MSGFTYFAVELVVVLVSTSELLLPLQLLSRCRSCSASPWTRRTSASHWTGPRPSSSTASCCTSSSLEMAAPSSSNPSPRQSWPTNLWEYVRTDSSVCVCVCVCVRVCGEQWVSYLPPALEYVITAVTREGSVSLQPVVLMLEGKEPAFQQTLSPPPPPQVPLQAPQWSHPQ